jgi:hypothetical protein
MITRQTGKKLIKASGILAILINIVIMIIIIAAGEWKSIFDIDRVSVLAHISLFVVGYYSLKMPDTILKNIWESASLLVSAQEYSFIFVFI